MSSTIKNNEKKSNEFSDFLEKHFRKFIYLFVIALHAIIILTVNFSLELKNEKKEDLTIFKIVDVKEYIPQEKKKEEILTAKQEKIVENVIETKSEVKELDVDYLPQHLISEMPIIPERLLNSKKVYPTLANKQGIEGIVFLELYIDQSGNIRNIIILKDPGYGFGEAAVKALKGIKCIPAKSNGVPVAVRIRYPVRFKLK